MSVVGERAQGEGGIGYYEFEKIIGKGNFAVVKLANHTLTNVKVGFNNTTTLYTCMPEHAQCLRDFHIILILLAVMMFRPILEHKYVRMKYMYMYIFCAVHGVQAYKTGMPQVDSLT